MNDTVHIVSAADQRYFPGLLGTLASLLTFADAGERFQFHVFDGGIDAASRRRLERLLDADPRDIALRWVTPDLSVFRSLSDIYGNFMTYTRLLIPALIDAPRAIWLDADLLVLRDIRPLWETDLQGNPVGACLEPEDTGFTADISNLGELGIPPGAPYHNAGVLLLDTSRLRDMDFSARALDYLATHHGKYHWHDQSAINVVLFGHIASLPPHWNTLSTVFSREPEQCTLQDGYVYHFLQRPKPWFRYTGEPHAVMLYDLLEALDCPLPELTAARRLAEKCKWLSPALTQALYTFRYRIAGMKADSNDVLTAWRANTRISKFARGNRLFAAINGRLRQYAASLGESQPGVLR